MMAPDSSSADDRRKEDRHRTRLRGGILRSRDGRRLLDCLIRDRSASGFKLVLFEDRLLPLELDLEDEADHRRYDIRIVRRNGPEIGAAIEREKSA